MGAIQASLCGPYVRTDLVYYKSNDSRQNNQQYRVGLEEIRGHKRQHADNDTDVVLSATEVGEVLEVHHGETSGEDESGDGGFQAF